MELHTTEIDGVRTFWVESGRPTLRASLMFRGGMADETLPTCGWTHLLEHLALHGRERVDLDVNGSVDLLVTSFDVHGEAGDVAEHLRALTTWLADPDLSDLEHERKVLRAESARRGGSAAADAMLWRYGARGPGLVAYDEPGLTRASVDALLVHAARRFTTGNAVLCFDGPPPPGLSLRLRSGEALLTQAATPCGQPLPGAYVGPDDAVCLSGLVRRSAASTALGRCLQRRLATRLRHEAGGSYAPWDAYHPVGADTAVLLAGADLMPELRPKAVSVARSVLQELMRSGPTSQEVAEDAAVVVRNYRDPFNQPGRAWASGRAVLLDEETVDVEDVLREAEQVTPDDVVEAARDVHRTLLVGAPRAARRDDSITWLDATRPAGTTSGERFRALDHPVDRSVITVSDGRVEVAGGDQARAVDLARLAGAFAFPDGGRTLVDQDGYTVAVEPTLWRNGGVLRERIDALVAPQLVLPMEPRDPQEVPRPKVTPAERWRLRLRGAIRAWWVAPVGFGALGMLVHATSGLNVLPVFVFSTVIFLGAWYRRDSR
ncbi:insulinase family protein [Oryzihumus leptocrescens]|uniref:Putative Zn-dependent peptidase n=1 Tax=Oryzihumus leptocrescens TaxID=297536 RepID=A0A542ZK77_9MICO|nr:insulinase family protein [Oryzihumus leptocrescens]TQL60746.1 putative Zn-dependent peptidase [Oryzihumus leptocrescens]